MAEIFKITEEFESYAKKHRVLRWFKLLAMNRKYRKICVEMRAQLLASPDPSVREIAYKADIAAREDKNFDFSEYDKAKQDMQDIVDTAERKGDE